MSFWSKSPGPHWSDSIWLCSGNSVVYPQPIRRFKLDKPKGNCVLATEHDADEIAEFLGRSFKITEKSICELSAERIQRGLQENWIVVLKRNQENKILGTIFSRSLGNCIFHNPFGKNMKSPNVGYIDFFCVDPLYRNSGLGSELLSWIDYYTNQKERFIHFFEKEIWPLTSLPPVWKGKYIVREVQNRFNNRIHQINILKRKQKSYPKFQISFQPVVDTEDSKLYFYDCGNFKINVAITDTFHSYQRGRIGELLFYDIESEETISEKSIAAALEEIVDNAGYQYILMDKSIPHLSNYDWKDDAPYYYYCYNVNPRHFFSVHPRFWF